MGIVLDFSAFQCKWAYPSLCGMDYERIAALHQSGELDGVIGRMVRGSYPDVRWPEYWEELGERGVPLAGYAVFDPFKSVPAQIDTYWNVDLVAPPVMVGPIRLAGDVEIPHPNLSKTVYATLLQQYLNGIEADTIYSSKYYWETLVGDQADGWQDPFWKWVAHYTSNPNPLLPNGWKGYILHQYSETGSGSYYGVGSTHVDLNRWSPSVPTDPPPLPPADCEPRQAIVTAPNGLNLRTRADLADKYKLRTMPFGEPLTVYGEIPMTQGYEWVIVRDSLGNVGCCASKFVEVVE